MMINLVIALLICLVSRVSSKIPPIRSIRGGLVPEPSEGRYYEKFILDYGNKDEVRQAGHMAGMLPAWRLGSTRVVDPFFNWLHEKLEVGPKPPSGRYKPFYAADFGSKADLKWGENPKIIIVNRKLACDEKGFITPGPSEDADVEIREVWQPWLKPKCNFVVRYIVPNRANILEIMEGQGRFQAEIHFGKEPTGARTATAHLIFRPTLWDRLRGHREVVMKKVLPAEQLFRKDKDRAHRAETATEAVPPPDMF